MCENLKPSKFFFSLFLPLSLSLTLAAMEVNIEMIFEREYPYEKIFFFFVKNNKITEKKPNLNKYTEMQIK